MSVLPAVRIIHGRRKIRNGKIGSYLEKENIMEEKKIVKEGKLSEESLDAVNGGKVVKHYCGYCGELMYFAYKQDYSYPMVYRCPQCGEESAFKK